MYIAHEVWPSGFAKDQSFKGPCAAPSTAGRIHASLERADCLFGAQRLGKQPRVANMLVEDYLRPAAAKAGILSWHRDDCGRLVEDDPRRFGFNDLRHSLASFLVRIRTDPKTVQTLLRHSDVKLTLQLFSHAVSQDRMAAAGEMLIAILTHAADQSGLGAD
jgi:integrase